MIIDKLYREVEDKGPICVGLDTDISYIPEVIKKDSMSVSDMIFTFNKYVIDYTKEYTAIYKPQIAYYEAQGIEGMKAYKKTLGYLRKNHLLIIADIKRGDISATASMYAKAHFSGDFEADFITINAYMGFDTIEPFIPYIKKGDKGIFVLLRTSNEGAKDIQYLKSQDKYVYNHIGDYLAQIGEKYKTDCGYSPIGMVTGGTHKKEATDIRDRYPNTFFLIPGYGAQGATGEDVKLYLKNGNGGVVNSSRAIIKSHINLGNTGRDFATSFTKAVIKMRGDLGVEK